MEPRESSKRLSPKLLQSLLVAALSLGTRCRAQTSPGASLPAAKALIEHGHYQQAQAILRQLLTTPEAQSNAAAHKLLAYTCLRLNDPKESLAEYTRAAAIETPTNLDLENVAKDYVLLNDLASADHWMARSLQMAPYDPEGWYGMGRIRFTQQRFPEAVECFKHSLRLLPGSVKAEDNLGLAYEGMNRQDDAVAAYRQAIAWQEQSPHPSEQPLLNLGIILIQRGETAEADKLLTQAAAIAPSDPRIHEQLGHLYLTTNYLNEARQHLETAIALDPKKPALHFLLGKVYHQQGSEAKAKQEFALASLLSGYHSTPAPF